MDKDTKKELAEIVEAITTARLSLSELHKKLEQLVTDEEGEVDDLEDADSDKNIERAEKCQDLRGAVDHLDEALQVIQEDVIDQLGE